MALQLIATCSLGLEEILAREIADLNVENIRQQRGAVSFRGRWPDCWRANWRLRTANRVLVELGRWNGADGDALAAGARALTRSKRKIYGFDAGALFDPRRTFSIRATTSASRIRDQRWAALRVKDGLVDGQRERYGKRSSIDRERPDLPLRLRLNRDEATLTLDTSGEPLDRRGYRVVTSLAPMREQLAAACVLASGWDGQGPVVDPMCGSGTLLAEAAWLAMGLAPGHLRKRWAFQRLPSYDATAFGEIRREPLPAPNPDVELVGIDQHPEAVRASRSNLERAGLADQARVRRGDAFDSTPPEGPGLFLVNPAYGERLEAEPAQWKRLGDLLKQHYKGYRAVVLAGGETLGKPIGLKPKRRIPVKNGPLEARILLFDIY